MNWQKGIKRTVIVVSIIAFILGFIVYVEYIDRQCEPIEAVAFSGFCFTVVWIFYFAVLWITKGFRDNEKKK